MFGDFEHKRCESTKGVVSFGVDVEERNRCNFLREIEFERRGVTIWGVVSVLDERESCGRCDLSRDFERQRSGIDKGVVLLALKACEFCDSDASRGFDCERRPCTESIILVFDKLVSRDFRDDWRDFDRECREFWDALALQLTDFERFVKSDNADDERAGNKDSRDLRELAFSLFVLIEFVFSNKSKT